jgi:pimeloyl-ACP methyl ester carboxylesterase
MEYARVGDLNMCYEVRGEGHPLMLIHGLTANMDWWDPEFIEALAGRYRVLAFDNRGVERTETPEDGEFTCVQMAGDTTGLMDAVGIEHAHLIGVSMGGMIAQELALNHPGRVEKLVLCCTYMGKKHAVYASREDLAVLADQSGGPEGVFDRMLPFMFPPEWIEDNPDAVAGFKRRVLASPMRGKNVVRQFMATTMLDTYERLGELAIPTMVATGTDDSLIPAVNSRMIAERIPGAVLKEYAGARHGFIAQVREDFLEDLVEFLG